MTAAVRGWMRRVDAHGYNHNLQVYKQAVENPSQGNITRVPMTSRELHGLVSGRRKEKLHGMLLLSRFSWTACCQSCCPKRVVRFASSLDIVLSAKQDKGSRPQVPNFCSFHSSSAHGSNAACKPVASAAPIHSLPACSLQLCVLIRVRP